MAFIKSSGNSMQYCRVMQKFCSFLKLMWPLKHRQQGASSAFYSDRKPNLMVTTRRKIGNFKSRILVSAEQARNETFLSLSPLSAEAFPCFLIHILVKCAKVLLKRQYRLPRSNGTQGEQIGIDLFVLSNTTAATEFFHKLATFTTQLLKIFVK